MIFYYLLSEPPEKRGRAAFLIPSICVLRLLMNPYLFQADHLLLQRTLGLVAIIC